MHARFFPPYSQRMRRSNQESRSAGGSSLSAQVPVPPEPGALHYSLEFLHAVSEDACSEDPASGPTAYPVAVSYQDETFCPGAALHGRACSGRLRLVLRLFREQGAQSVRKAPFRTRPQSPKRPLQNRYEFFHAGTPLSQVKLCDLRIMKNG